MRRVDDDRIALKAACAVAFVVTACAREAAPPSLATPIAAPVDPLAPAVTPMMATPVTPKAAATTPSGPAPAMESLDQAAHDKLVATILSGGGPALKAVLAAPESHRFQVLYGLVKDGKLERHGFRADAEYFFPASSMKMPITLATYDNAAAKPWFLRDATMKIHPLAGGDPTVTTLARETYRALIVSDNTSANRLLGIVGHKEAHETLWGLGLSSVRIRGGFSPAETVDPPEVSPKIEVGTETIAQRKSDLVLPANDAAKLEIGKAYIGDNGQRIEKPMSFAAKNAVKLKDLQDTLIRIMRPELLPAGTKKDPMRADDLAYLRQTLGTLPSESGLAGFDRNVVADYQLIPFLRGIERVRQRGKFEIHSKVGQAFGFLIGNAYVVDKDTGRAFFLIAAIYANKDEVLNDDDYDYDDVAFPALADVAEVFCRHAFGG